MSPSSRPVHPERRVPTGELDRVLEVAVDSTARPPLLVLTTLRRSPAEVSDEAFRPVHVTTLQLQYADVLIARIRAAVAPNQEAEPWA